METKTESIKEEKRKMETKAEIIMLPLGMVLVQIFVMGMLLLSKTVLAKGMFVFTLLCYRNIIGALVMVPFSLFLEREMSQKLSWSAFMWIFLNAMLGMVMGMGLYYYGLKDTSASYAANYLNMMPIVTFIIAVIIRVESLGLGSKAGKVKVLGTLLSVGGAMVVTLYHGKGFHLPSSHLHNTQQSTQAAGGHNMVRGSLFLVGSIFSYSLWFIGQVKCFKVFPSKYWTTMLTCCVGCLQALVIGIAINRERSTWTLTWDLNLLTIVYSGILNSGCTYCLMSWAISRRGPTYPSVFNPLSVIFTIIIEFLFMGHEITTGSLLGTVLIIGGLYAFLWGKTKEVPLHKKNIVEDSKQVASGYQA